MMNKWLKILLGVAVFLVLAIAAAFFFTSGIVETADDFFKAVKSKDMAKARSFLAEEFKASTDEKALNDFLSSSALLNFKECKWSNRQISGGRGELEGSVTTETGGAIPIKMMFVKEKDAWKIYAIQKPAAGLKAESSPPAVPTKSAQVALVKQSMRDFIISINNKSMEHFRSTVSQLWQKQYTTEKLNQAFKVIIDSGVNWSVLNDLDPVIMSDPVVDKDGVLLLEGHYPTKPGRVYFKQKYIYEGVAWKLLGFNIEVT